MNTTINPVIVHLGDYYPDSREARSVVEVSAEVAAFLKDTERSEHNYNRRCRYNHANGYIDVSEEFACRYRLIVPQSVEEQVERRIDAETLHQAIDRLPAVQARRLKLFYFSGYSKAKIAAIEGVDASTVRESITAALTNLKKYFEMF